MSGKLTRKAFSDPFTPQQEADLAAIEAKGDQDIDFSDMPEITDFAGFSRPRPSDFAQDAVFNDPSTNYCFSIHYALGGQANRVMILSRAETDEEALRAAHPLADLAELMGAKADNGGATNVSIEVTARSGRMVGKIGDAGSGSDAVDRAEIKAPTFEASMRGR